MKIMIHGGFFSESTQSEEIKRLKQDALGEIIQNHIIFYCRIQLLTRLFMQYNY